MGRTAGSLVVLMLLAGCATGPVLDTPPGPPPGPATVAPGDEYNPLYTARSGPEAYQTVFENVLTSLAESGFDLLEHNRYDGHIKTKPRVKPGLVQPFVSGSADFSDRLLATFQSYRQYAVVKIQPAEGGGFFIHVLVYTELEDLPRPTRATAGAVLYQHINDVERQFEIIDPTRFESNWIPKGRDPLMEQIILHRLRELM
jgi:hypothetical protein